MTRINLVDPKLLVRQHLVAEYRELPRIYALVRSRIAAGETLAQAQALSPPAYTLGTGHCRFFYPRLGWLTHRFNALVTEMRARGYQPTHTRIPEFALDIPSGWHGQWEPTPACVALNVERINTRLRGMGLADQQIVL